MSFEVHTCTANASSGFLPVTLLRDELPEEHEVFVPRFLLEEIRSPALAVTRLTHTSSSFTEILDVAASAYGRQLADVSYPVDKYAEIYAVRSNRRIVGTISVVRAALGPIVFEEMYPLALLSALRPVLCCAYRLCVLPSFSGDGRVSRALMKASWADEMLRGVRAAAVHVNERMVPYYQKLGFIEVRNGHFRNPRYGTPSHIMICPASIRHRSAFRRICLEFRGHLNELNLDGLVEPFADTNIRES